MSARGSLTPSLRTWGAQDRPRLLSAVVGRVLVGVIRLYQAVPRVGPGRCRFYPSCSSYAVRALALHGPVRGGWLAVKRLGRCHPWQPGGVDHVPARTVG